MVIRKSQLALVLEGFLFPLAVVDYFRLSHLSKSARICKVHCENDRLLSTCQPGANGIVFTKSARCVPHGQRLFSPCPHRQPCCVHTAPDPSGQGKAVAASDLVRSPAIQTSRSSTLFMLPLFRTSQRQCLRSSDRHSEKINPSKAFTLHRRPCRLRYDHTSPDAYLARHGNRDRKGSCLQDLSASPCVRQIFSLL
jgi:hypothetical protein